jgi:hypothetical protein
LIVFRFYIEVVFHRFSRSCHPTPAVGSDILGSIVAGQLTTELRRDNKAFWHWCSKCFWWCIVLIKMSKAR